MPDRPTILAAAKANGNALAHAGPFRDDKEVVLAALGRSGSALQYASEELRGDREVVLGAVSAYGPALAYASDTCRADPDIVRAAVTAHPEALACSPLRKDQAFVISLAETNPEALAHVEPDLWLDTGFVARVAAVSGFGAARAEGFAEPLSPTAR